MAKIILDLSGGNEETFLNFRKRYFTSSWRFWWKTLEKILIKTKKFQLKTVVWSETSFSLNSFHPRPLPKLLPTNNCFETYLYEIALKISIFQKYYEEENVKSYEFSKAPHTNPLRKYFPTNLYIHLTYRI